MEYTMVTVKYYLTMEVIIKVSGKMDKEMESENINIQQEIHIKAVLLKGKNMERELDNLEMEFYMKDVMQTIKILTMVLIHLLTGQKNLPLITTMKYSQNFKILNFMKN